MENRSRSYVIPGRPIPLKRPRFSVRQVYDSQKDVRNSVGLVLRSQHRDKSTLTGMMHMHIDFFMELPKKKSHREHLFKQRFHCYKPDISNLIKFVEDICVDVGIIEDDALIVEISAKKVYSDQPRTEFYFTFVEDDYESTEEQT